jgi:hypothetical protein
MSKHNPFADLKALRQSAEVVDFPPAKASSRAKRSRRLVAFPWAFLVDACSLTTGEPPCRGRIHLPAHPCLRQLTVSLPSAELAELRISRVKLKR